MKVFVVGPGAVGTYISAKLAQMTDTTQVTREGRRLPATIKVSGAENFEYRPKTLSWSEIKKFPEKSLIIVATKAFSLATVLHEIATRVDGSQRVVLAMNGLGVFEEAESLLKKIDGQQILSAKHLSRMTLWLGVRFTTPQELQVIGVDACEWSEGDPDVFKLFLDSRLSIRTDSNLKKLEWKKALANIVINGVCALTQSPNGAVLKEGVVRELSSLLFNEAMNVAHAEGLKLDSSTRHKIDDLARVTADNFNSTLQDLREKRPSEIPWLNGAVVRYAKKHGLEVPANQMIAGIIEVLELNY